MVGAIDASNTGSLRLHARLGFVQTGLMPQVGRKFGRWLDLALVQRTSLTPCAGNDGETGSGVAPIAAECVGQVSLWAGRQDAGSWYYNHD